VKPEVSRFLEVASEALLAEMVPNIAPAYRQASLMTTGVMIGLVRDEFERAAERRVVENRELRRIFQEAVSIVQDQELSDRLASAAAGQEKSFLISELERNNAELRGLLIELHAHVEGQATPEALRLEAQIWRELVASTERRRVAIALF
jgi:hypothetical protein